MYKSAQAAGARRQPVGAGRCRRRAPAARGSGDVIDAEVVEEEKK